MKTQHRIFRIMVFCLPALLSLTTASRAGEFTIDAAAMVKAHNEQRAAVGSPKVKWSKELESKAINRLKQLQKLGCVMKHSGPGENLFWASARETANKKNAFGQWIWHSTVQKISEKEVVSMWASEKEWYAGDRGTCHAPLGETCGHYTQLVWEDTREIGCGRSICRDKSQVWLCLYSPSGNIIGQRPY
ncbi:MAG: CAP domain-containing protein [Desulfobulbaceae bacterium]|nr:CAP domain-containing protein [Desulfobulbaceae bacterium]